MRVGVTLVMCAVLFAAMAAAVIALSNTPGSFEVEAEARRTVTTSANTSVTVVAGDTAGSIGRRLVANDAVDSYYRFELLALLLGWESSLESGAYTFEPGLTTYEILRRIHSGETSPWRVVLPEGLRLEQVTERLVEAEVVDAASFLAVVSTPSADLVAGTLAELRPTGTSLEGYLFPSAYTFPLSGSADDAVRQMLQRFDDALTPDLRNQISQSGRTLHEIVTIASIIEREVVEDAERVLVSAVIWNRLAAGMPLQFDSTVQYAVGQPAEWWKRELSRADLALQSPFNTYVASGLPPAPISSPGLDSIAAAANPAAVPYLFFFARGDGTHAFAVTFEEHQANVERYRGVD
ncbi:MAG: endolytic transglycosylase MltG [Chloroflexi bacterium]|nr:endolytic transglycosylase MltG [Chloroflexota bacterium]MYB21926.1 endolytic transglycosylase MltG [Chloroflexota bacterium]MYD17562.1 endolytic transglycosylase MltG [Chloroflexota bacterium]MYF81763.1 endolytic transglycosylase MltG [Chloroflexota bacterium]MYI04882.1 endolytic transglycosylase MltG [Chloroflexota bacterium]